MYPSPSPPSVNNFDLIRLLAAIQVVIGHAFLIGFFPHDLIYDIIWFIPGVPVFFGMSGFLLLWSFERRPDLLSYLKNRFLRLYPALWATMFLTLVILLVFHTLSIHSLTDPSLLMYLVGRCSFIFYFVPAVVKKFAQGNPNGSLWTIGVELQFYFFLPLIAWLIKKQPLGAKNLFLISIACISWWIDRHDPQPPFDVKNMNGYLQIFVSEFRILYYLFFFIIGMLFYLNYRWLKKFLEGHFVEWFVFYVLISALSWYFTDLSKVDRYAPDPLSLLRHIFLMWMVFSAAVSNPGLANKILKGNDYSYGIYLNHFLILNAFYQLNKFSGPVNFSLAILCTLILAWISWHCIEKRALRLKKHSLRNMLRKTQTFSIQKTSV